MAGLSAEGDRRHVRGVSFQEHLVDGYKCGGVPYALGVVERDNARESDENLSVKSEELFDEFGRACKAVYVDFCIVQVGSAENGKGVVIGFAEVEHEWLSAFDAELQMTFKELDLCYFSFCAVVVVETEFTAGDALRMGEVFEESGFVFGRFRFDIFGMDAVGGVDVVVFFAEFAGVFEICRVASDVDKRFGLCNLGCCGLFFGGVENVRETRCAETFEKSVKEFARMALVRINMTMSIDEHRGVGYGI